jgi:hypothetical protein
MFQANGERGTVKRHLRLLASPILPWSNIPETAAGRQEREGIAAEPALVAHLLRAAGSDRRHPVVRLPSQPPAGDLNPGCAGSFLPLMNIVDLR